MNFDKNGGKNLWSWTVLDLHGITPLQEEVEIMHLHQDGHLCSRGKKGPVLLFTGLSWKKKMYFHAIEKAMPNEGSKWF